MTRALAVYHLTLAPVRRGLIRDEKEELGLCDCC